MLNKGVPMASKTSFRGEDEVRILVVEDDPRDQELLLHQLRECQVDHHIKFLATGEEALDFLNGPQGTLVAENLVALFLDLKLPGLGGLELLRQLRKKYRRLPVIVMTGSENPKD